jgi:hypothetical protein
MEQRFAGRWGLCARGHLLRLCGCPPRVCSDAAACRAAKHHPLHLDRLPSLGAARLSVRGGTLDVRIALPTV